MAVFNSFYYSFSPNVAEYVASDAVARSLLKALLYPLIKILSLAELSSRAFTFNGELGALVAGLVASALIGAVYLFPLMLMPLILMDRRGMRLNRKSILRLTFLFLVSILVIVIGEFSKSASAMMFATSSFVLTTIFLSGLLLGAAVVKNSIAFKRFISVRRSSRRFSLG